jgi:hypothetical protein
MNALVFNLCMLIGWLMVLVGGYMVSPAWGILGAGAVLIAFTFVWALLAGVQNPSRKRGID